MANITSTVDAILLMTPKVTVFTPVDASAGIAVGQNIEVTFNVAVDPTSVTLGHLIVTQAADNVAATGPGLFRLLTGKLVTDNLLSTPALRGVVKGAISTADNLKFVLNPTELLAANQEYQIQVSDEIVSNTLTTPAADGGNTGTGKLTVTGPYTGTWAPETFTVEVTTGGALNTAVFRWKQSSVGTWTSDITMERTVKIADGITLKFDQGVYDATDTFTFDASQGIKIGSITTAKFTTGSPTTVTPPVAVESNEIVTEEVGGITRITSMPTPVGVGLRVLSITPADLSTDMELTTKVVKVKFNKTIDATTINDETVQVFMETLPTDHETRKSEPLGKVLSVSGDTLTIELKGV